MVQLANCFSANASFIRLPRGNSADIGTIINAGYYAIPTIFANVGNDWFSGADLARPLQAIGVPGGISKNPYFKARTGPSPLFLQK